MESVLKVYEQELQHPLQDAHGKPHPHAPDPGSEDQGGCSTP
jgi:hypothetical protein